MSSGKISGTPPTRVATMNSPVEAASMMLIPKASVKDVLRYMWPLTNTWLRELTPCRCLRQAHISDVCGCNRAKELDTVLKLIFLAQLLELYHLWPVAADYEANVGMEIADLWSGRYEEVDAFSVDESGHDDDVDYHKR
jgi:hypothetical protein